MKLTDRFCRTAPPGKYSDDQTRGLLFLVRDGSSRSWVLRYQLNGRRRDMGLGAFPWISLAEARDRAFEAQRMIKRDKIDPLANRTRNRPRPFREVAAELIESKKAGWTNEKHKAQWGSSLETYAYPVLGRLDVKDIGTDDILRVLRPVWTEKPQTASRVRQRIEAVLDYAGALKLRSGDNPARWRGHLDHLLAKPSKVKAVEHHAALPWQEAPVFMAALAERPGTSARALEFLILTAARTGEVRGLTWAEIDLEAKIWTVPAGRIKAGKEHRVPLTPAAIALLGDPGEPDDLVFPSPYNRRKPLGGVALQGVLQRMKVDVTPHGMRSCFRDWAGETTSHPREVIEAALAHGLKDKSEAAYARGDLLAKRRKLMDEWASYLAAPAATVTRIDEAKAAWRA